MFNKQKIKDRVQKRVANHIRSRLQRIEVRPAQGMFNYNCYWNSAQYAFQRPGYSVVEVIYIDDDGAPVLHYINCDDRGVYLETTLGYLSEHLEYYFVKTVLKDDFKFIANSFSRTLDTWLQEHTSWFERKFGKIERVL